MKPGNLSRQKKFWWSGTDIWLRRPFGRGAVHPSGRGFSAALHAISPDPGRPDKGTPLDDWSYLKNFYWGLHNLWINMTVDHFISEAEQTYPLRGIRILVDTGHAAAGDSVPLAFEYAGAGVVGMNTDVQEIGGESHRRPFATGHATARDRPHGRGI